MFPSLWYEGQPLTVLEAKGLGTPVIVADGCAGREEIEDGVSGLWFKGGDADDLARALERIGNDALVTRAVTGRVYELLVGAADARAACPSDNCDLRRDDRAGQVSP